MAKRAMSPGWGLWLLVAATGLGCSPGPAAGPLTGPPVRLGKDRPSRMAVRHEIRLEPADGPGQYRVRITEEVTERILSRRDLARPFRFIFDSPLGRVRDLHASLDGRRLPPHRIEWRLAKARHVFLEDSRIYRMSFPIARLGSVISYRYWKERSDPALLFPALIPNPDHLVRYELIVNHPPGVRVMFQRGSPALPRPPRIERGAQSSRLVVSDVPGRAPLAYYPFNGMRGVVWPIFRTAAGAVQPVTPTALGRWWRQLIGVEPALLPRHVAFAKRLVAQASAPRERARALFDFVRRQIRYVADERGIGRLVPRTANVVLDRRWGDCKDKAHLLEVLGKAVGVPFDLVLVAVREKPRFGAVWHTFQFDHVIASFRDGDRRIYLDPTASDVPFGQLPEAVIDKQALLLDARAPLALRIPAPSQAPSFDVEVTGSLERLSKAKASIRVRNRLLRRVRFILRRYDGDAERTRLSALLGSQVPALGINEVHLVRSSPTVAAFRARANLATFVLTTSSGIHLPRAPFGFHSPLLGEREKDPLEIVLPRRPNLRVRLSLRAPADLTYRGRPFALGVRRAVRYDAAVSAGSGRVRASYRLRQLRRYFVGDTRARLLRFHRRYRRARRRHYHLLRGAK